MVWWPFATKPERADTLEVIDLHSGAPLLYSTIFVVVNFYAPLRRMKCLEKTPNSPAGIS